MVQFEDRAVTGDLVKAMPEAERWFEVIEKPYYEEVESKDGMKRKLAVRIKFSDGRMGVYYPNRTSAREMDRSTNAMDMDDWVGKKFHWGRLLQQNVFGETKWVPYVTGLYPPAEKVK